MRKITGTVHITGVCCLHSKSIDMLIFISSSERTMWILSSIWGHGYGRKFHPQVLRGCLGPSLRTPAGSPSCLRLSSNNHLFCDTFPNFTRTTCLSCSYSTLFTLYCAIFVYYYYYCMFSCISLSPSGHISLCFIHFYFLGIQYRVWHIAGTQ